MWRQKYEAGGHILYIVRDEREMNTDNHLSFFFLFSLGSPCFWACDGCIHTGGRSSFLG